MAGVPNTSPKVDPGINKKKTMKVEAQQSASPNCQFFRGLGHFPLFSRLPSSQTWTHGDSLISHRGNGKQIQCRMIHCLKIVHYLAVVRRQSICAIHICVDPVLASWYALNHGPQPPLLLVNNEKMMVTWNDLYKPKISLKKYLSPHIHPGSYYVSRRKVGCSVWPTTSKNMMPGGWFSNDNDHLVYLHWSENSDLGVVVFRDE